MESYVVCSNHLAANINSLNRGSVNNIFVKFKMFVSYWHCNVLEHNFYSMYEKDSTSRNMPVYNKFD